MHTTDKYFWRRAIFSVFLNKFRTAAYNDLSVSTDTEDKNELIVVDKNKNNINDTLR